MKTLESNRKLCLTQQSALRHLLEQSKPPADAVERFLEQHARLHSAQANLGASWSYEDEIFNGLRDAQARTIPPKSEHSIAWMFWHIARIEDIAMNLLVAGNEQVFGQGDWQGRLKVSWCDSGNAMSTMEIAALSAAIDLPALRKYRAAVGCRTQEIVRGLQPQDLPRKVDARRIQRVRDEGAVLEAASGITDYWSKRTIAGLLLMPASRHILVHLNEALEIKGKCKGEAFAQPIP